MSDNTVTVPTALMKALVANVTFQGQRHGKFVSAEEANGFNGDYGHKMREHLMDSDTKCIAVTSGFVQFELEGTWSFDRLKNDGFNILFAYTVPIGLSAWTDFGRLPEIDRRYVREKV